MGNASWSSKDYATRSAVYQTKSQKELFGQRKVNPNFDPKKIQLRESRDSEANPLSTPIIIGLDVTGSMGFIAENIAKQSLGILVENLLDSQVIPNPHIMMMAIGDVFNDTAPLQATQFEADIRIAEQLTQLFLEGGGGGNSFESYDLPWLFAAHKTQTDAFEKRQQKGFLFTIGDELPPKIANYKVLNKALNLQLQADISLQDLLNQTKERYEVFHIIIEEGSFASRCTSQVLQQWQLLLGKRAIPLNNYLELPFLIQNVIKVAQGQQPETLIENTQSSDKRLVLEHAFIDAVAQ